MGDKSSEGVGDCAAEIDWGTVRLMFVNWGVMRYRHYFLRQALISAIKLCAIDRSYDMRLGLVIECSHI